MVVEPTLVTRFRFMDDAPLAALGAEDLSAAIQRLQRERHDLMLMLAGALLRNGGKMTIQPRDVVDLGEEFDVLAIQHPDGTLAVEARRKIEA